MIRNQAALNGSTCKMIDKPSLIWCNRLNHLRRVFVSGKIEKGDGIRIVSPATSMSAMSDENINAAKTKLEELGFCLFSENAKK